MAIATTIVTTTIATTIAVDFGGDSSPPFGVAAIHATRIVRGGGGGGSLWSRGKGRGGTAIHGQLLNQTMQSAQPRVMEFGEGYG